MALPVPRPWPVPMWPEFWPWAGWKLAGSPTPQPADAKKLAARYHKQTGKWGVPKWAWVRLSYMKAKQVVPIPSEPTPPFPFNGRGAFLLEPTGGTEDIGAMKEAGFTYLLLNIGFGSGGNWITQRQRAANLGMAVVPWQRCYTEEHVRKVEETRMAWGSLAAGHNIESPEVGSTMTPAKLQFVTQQYADIPRAVITEPWMQNGAGWSALKNWVAMPETFMNSNPIFNPAVVTEHAHNEGVKYAVPAFGWGVWSDAQHLVSPAEYLSRWKYSWFAVYPVDGREGQLGQWVR